MFAATKKNQMQIRVPPGTLNNINELLAYQSLYGRRISDFINWARMESHITSIVVMKSTVAELKVTGLKKPVFGLACMCLHPIDKRKK